MEMLFNFQFNESRKLMIFFVLPLADSYALHYISVSFSHRWCKRWKDPLSMNNDRLFPLIGKLRGRENNLYLYEYLEGA